VEELVKEYVRQDAVTEIQELLADAGLSLEALTADELADRPEYLDYIERVDRPVSIAESRRNASPREIERRRAQPSMRRAEDPMIAIIGATTHSCITPFGRTKPKCSIISIGSNFVFRLLVMRGAPID